MPKKILTDQDTHFTSVFKNTCKLLKIEKIQITAYYPENNGALERLHRTEYLKHYVNEDQIDWDKLLLYAMFTYNITSHTVIRFIPFLLMYDHQAILPTALTKQLKPTYSYDNYAQELRERIRTTNHLAKEHIKQKKIKAKHHYDKSTSQ